MIMKLEKEAESEATEKAYCDEEMAKTEAKKAELAKTAKEQADMDALRADQNANYKVASAELTQGLTGVRKALDVLRNYYGGGAAMIQEDATFNSFMQQPAPPQQHEKSAGAGGSIISILEVCESDFATGLAKEESAEADSAANYEKVTQ